MCGHTGDIANNPIWSNEMATRAKTKITEAIDKFTEAREELMQTAGVPSWKRKLVSTMTSLIASCTTYVAGVSLTAWIIEIVLIPLSTPAFIQLVILMIGVCLSMMLCFFVYEHIDAYISNGIIDTHWNTVRIRLGRMMSMPKWKQA